MDQLVGKRSEIQERRAQTFLSCKKGRKGVIFTVEDKGIGISSEDLPYIFEKGYVGKILRKGDYHSTGMGLAFAKSIAQLLCISIEVSSREGEGTCFSLYFQDTSDHLLLP